MCGIFGSIGQKINPGIIRALAIVNRERGEDSLGFFSNSGKFVKCAADPINCLCSKDFNTFIDCACQKGWFIAGHTRWATSGTVTSENAHPFRYGRIIGSHNGIVDAPKTYEVDSEYLFDLLNKSNGDYQKLGGVRGSWALSWFDGECFYLQAHNQAIAIGQADNGTWYYSSDLQHLLAAAGFLNKITILQNNATIRFNIKSQEFERLPDLIIAKLTKAEKKAKRRLKQQFMGFETHAARIKRAEDNPDPFNIDNEDSAEDKGKWWNEAWGAYVENDERLD